MNSYRHWILFALFLLLPGMLLGQSASTQTVLLFPFNDTTHKPGMEWISEAFPEILSQRLTTESLYLISREDRQMAFDRMGIPLNVHASRATLYRIATQLDADYIVLGSYGYDGKIFTARAQVLDMKVMRLSPVQVESGPLQQFLTIQTALAWDVLRQMRPKFSEPRDQFLLRAPTIRLDAFENFIRGVVASAGTDRIRYLKAAIAIDPHYSEAILLLGKTYFAAKDYQSTSLTLTNFPTDDTAFAEASFYLGLSEFHLGHFEKAYAAFKATSERVPLTEVLNNIGAAESRRGRHDAGDYFLRAVQADPSDADYHFNLAVALYRKGDIPGAQRQLQQTLSIRPTDNEAHQLRDAITAGTPATVPLARIKANYDESSYRQLAMELQNAIDASIRKAQPAIQASLHLERARELLASGSAIEAESQFRESLLQQPGNPEALAGLAHALLLENKFADARTQAQTANDIEPSAEAYVVLARADLHDHKRDAAWQNLQKAMAIEPGSDEAQKVADEMRNQPADEAR